ncbi:MAG: AAA family ATPase, partial [Halobacterium sp.]
MPSYDLKESELPKPDIKQKLVDSLGASVQWHSDTDVEGVDPFYLHLNPPLPELARTYLFNIVPSGRDDEYKINTRLPKIEGTDDRGPDRSDNYLVLIGGYHEYYDVFAFWDDSLHNLYSSNPPMQIMPEQVKKAASEGFAIYERDSAGEGGETVVAVESSRVDEAIALRHRFIRNRQILNEYLHEDWRNSGSRAQVVERIVDLVLEETDSERPMSERRKDAVREVANERSIKSNTVENKLKGDLFPDRSHGKDGYIETHFDPLLRDVEDAVRTEREEIDSDFLRHIETVDNEISIHVASQPPEDWIVSCYYNCLPFTEDEEELYNSLDPEDIVLFHLNEESDILNRDDYESGLIGGAITTEIREKSSPRWHREHEGSEIYSHVVPFQRVFYSGRSGELDLTKEIDDKSDSEIKEEVLSLTTNLFAEDRADEILSEDFPPSQKLDQVGRGSNPVDLEPARELVKQLAKRISEAPSVNIFADYDGKLDEEIFDGLYLPGQKEDILAQVNSALRTGKHIIFTGPPGTGKTEIASNIAELLEDQHPWQFSGSQITTATSDWSTFDTLGGYMPEEDAEGGDHLSFTSGILLNRLKKDQTLEQRNEPIVIDELNRSNIDEAFGQLFTVLSGESVQLQYTRNGEELEIVTAESLDGLPDDNQYTVPESWRILATMNTFDKNSLYEMSYAFMRRFSFITINDPFQQGSYETDEELYDLMRDYDEHWGTGSTKSQKIAVATVWKHTNTAIDN